MGNKGFIKFTQLFLWALTSVSLIVLLTHNKTEVHSLDVFSTTLAGIKFAIGLRFDILSSLLFFMITALGAGIGHYSLRYLDGDDRQSYFYKHLLGIILSASLMVLATNLLMFFLTWLAISYHLHKLLVYFADRPQALLAARKKAIVSRLGDVALLAAIALSYSLFGTFEFSEIFAQAQAILPNSESQGTISLIGILVAIGSLTKSAQFPFHFWLPDTMETPTPVSAIMHAGVINAGGFLIIRMSPVFQHALAPHIILAVVGTISAVFGALCMITQNDIKKKLAYSTISQMGMMMFACGIGAYSAAMFHIFAHSFYKAYAFLSTGKLVEESKKIGLSIQSPSVATIMLAGLTGFAAIASGALYDQGQYIPTATYGAILFLGLFQSLSAMNSAKVPLFRSVLQIAGTMLLATGIYLGIEQSLSAYLGEFVPSLLGSPFDRYTLTAICALSFAAYFGSFVLNARLMNINTPFLERTYMYLKNGGYFGARSTMFLTRLNLQPQTRR